MLDSYQCVHKSYPGYTYMPFVYIAYAFYKISNTNSANELGQTGGGGGHGDIQINIPWCMLTQSGFN